MMKGQDSPRSELRPNESGRFRPVSVIEIGTIAAQRRRAIEEKRMESNSADTLLVISSVESAADGKRPERGIGGKLASSMVHGVSVSVLKRNMDVFFDQIREILQNGCDRIGEFQISEIEVCAQISGEGQVALLGSGAKIEAQGGVKFTLCRVPATT